MQTEMKEVEQRIKGYWYRDGFGEMAGGLVFLILGGYFALSEALGDSVWGGILQAGLIIVLIGLMYVGRRLVSALKSRFVYPRTGFVEYRVEEDKRHARKLLAGVVAAVMAAGFVLVVRLSSVENLTAALTGLAGGVILIFFRTKAVGLARFTLMGIISIGLGLVLAFSEIAMDYALGLYYGLMALVFFISGALVLNKYLRDNPRPAKGSRE